MLGRLKVNNCFKKPLLDTHSSISEMNFVSNLPGVNRASEVCPLNSSLSSVSFTSSSRTISPKYMPLIIFSKLQETTNSHQKVSKSWILKISQTLCSLTIFSVSAASVLSPYFSLCFLLFEAFSELFLSQENPDCRLKHLVNCWIDCQEIGSGIHVPQRMHPYNFGHSLTPLVPPLLQFMFSPFLLLYFSHLCYSPQK